MRELPAQTFVILHKESVGKAKRAGKTLAAAVGFDAEACEQVVLVIIELATNLVKHARGGTIILTPLIAGKRAGLQIESIDQGPGIADIEQAIADGFTTIIGSLGVGLGTVNRLMDELDIVSERGRGAHITSRKWVRQYAVSLRPCPLDLGAATRSRLMSELNGDAFTIKQWGECALVGIMDGLGHGEFAHRAAETARQYVENHFDQPLALIFRGVGHACRATRGLVMALAHFDWGKGRLTFASLGNIEVRVFPSSAPFRFIIRRGVVGLRAPNVVVTEHPWTGEHVMVLHSDGLTSRWSWKDFPGLEGKPAAVAAQELLRALAKDLDDATVVVVRSKVS